MDAVLDIGPITGTLARLPLQKTVINCKRERFPEEIVIKD